MARAFTVRQLCFAHLAYVETIKSTIASGVGSRGSALVTYVNGQKAHLELGDEWKFAPEDPAFREKVLETVVDADGNIDSSWQPRKEVPTPDAWFETAWVAYRNREIYK